jgi:ATP-binding cassette subfamily B protein RaxB
MSFLDKISFGFGARLPVVLQTEATECGLACISMVAAYHGLVTDMTAMRRLFNVSMMGATLEHLMQVAQTMELGTRAVKLELEDLPQLKLPCILHWNFNHFVVLKEVGAKSVVIHDPAVGMRRVPMSEVSKSFTGVALELWPNQGFKRAELRQHVKLRQLMGQVTGLYRSFGQILLLATALEVFTLVSPFFVQWVIDDVIVSADRDLLTTLGIGFSLLVIMQQGVSMLRAWVLMHFSTTLNVQWRANIFSHLIRLPVEYFEKRHLGDVVSRFGSIDTIQKTLTSSFLEAILDGVMSIMMLAVMFIYSPFLAGIAVGVMVVYAIVRTVWYRPLRDATLEQIVHAARQQTHFLESMRGIKAIKLFQRHNERRDSWLALLVDQVNADLRTQKMLVIYQNLNGLLFGLERVVIIWLGALIVLDGKFTVGALMAFAAYKDQFTTRISSLIDKFFEVKMLQLHGERLADIAFTEPENTSAPAGALDNKGLTSRIELKGLRYRYGDQQPWVLDGLDLAIEPGESIAIVGPSGCGKTTLINVILGVRMPSEGEVLIGGVSVARVGINTLRSMVGTVMQDDVLFAGSIADNISFFDPKPDMARVLECAHLAAIHDEIAATAMGYNTLVGDMGTVLSGGQRQRVLLARALYKRPSILLLDEATSHLDIQRESLVNHAIKSLPVTRVIIAHRPETIASADRVIVLAGGKIVADSRVPGETTAQALAAVFGHAAPRLGS